MALVPEAVPAYLKRALSTDPTMVVEVSKSPDGSYAAEKIENIEKYTPLLKDDAVQQYINHIIGIHEEIKQELSKVVGEGANDKETYLEGVLPYAAILAAYQDTIYGDKENPPVKPHEISMDHIERKAVKDNMWNTGLNDDFFELYLMLKLYNPENGIATIEQLQVAVHDGWAINKAFVITDPTNKMGAVERIFSAELDKDIVYSMLDHKTYPQFVEFNKLSAHEKIKDYNAINLFFILMAKGTNYVQKIMTAFGFKILVDDVGRNLARALEERLYSSENTRNQLGKIHKNIEFNKQLYDMKQRVEKKNQKLQEKLSLLQKQSNVFKASQLLEQDELHKATDADEQLKKLDNQSMNTSSLNQWVNPENNARNARGGGHSPPNPPAKKYVRSDVHAVVNGKKRVVYLGPRGGRYVKSDGKYVALSK